MRHGGGDKKSEPAKSGKQESAYPIDSTPTNELTGQTRDIAAKATGVSHYTVDRARAVKKADPEEFERVKRGETTVEAAHRKVVQSKPKPTKRQPIRDNAAKQKMIAALSHICGLCKSLGELKIPVVINGCTQQELRAWASSARESAKLLRGFAAVLGFEEKE